MLLRNILGAFRGPNGKKYNHLGPTQFSQIFILKETMTTCVYEKAIAALNGLQSNAAYLQKARAERSSKAYQNIIDTKHHLETLHITLSDVDSLNIIHIAGTKGKGSTCAFTENILRNHGYKTGFYSSPHLISVNERIRINGNPLSKEKFAVYFWEVYDAIKCNLKEEERMPSYFLFLTVMAFYVFIKEKVEATIIEVGIGGLYDCTNFIRKPVAVGITTLGIDHVNLLGGTITEIAEQKAGIMKSGVPAFTVSQPENALRVLRKKAQVVQCPLVLSPPLESYENKISLGIQGVVQSVNASLALQLSHCWLTSIKFIDQNSSSTQQLQHFENLYLNEELPLMIADTFFINKETHLALENCIWPGRFQTLEKDRLTFYLDGAHTHESMKHCGRWFEEAVLKHNTKFKLPALKVLYFNCTGERRAESLLDPLADIHFDVVLFSPNKISNIKDTASDLSNFMVEPAQEMQQCIANNEIWCHLMRSLYENQLSISNYSSSNFAGNEASIDCDNTVIFPSITDAIDWISSLNYQRTDQEIKVRKLRETLLGAHHVHVLVTGSLHLVGGVLSLIQS
ncbi:folylpolyglutamate synthase, mitochondrial [Parasteatoda tepidariorum]|uniref:folylpolyglutamate synthase, mitochondrial n=1 Tax=Parasteatoda tepidariorum TaxID=114398 RepID=UPI001C71B7E4|nr:folylpolyglutamate synthase, mitochondrial [Parasteatoda tepidariorum]